MTDETGRPVVLIALDGLPAAASALPIARSVARQLDAFLKVLHVTPTAEQNIPDLPLDDAELQVELGDVVGCILGNAADPRVAVVVLTTHGREVESDGRLGHVAEAVTARTEQPVLLVRPGSVARWQDNGRGLRHVLLPLDGTPTTAFLLRPAMQLCAQLGATIDVLYVAGALESEEPGSIGIPRYVDQPQYEWPQWSAEVLDRLVGYCAACPPEVGARAYLATGDAGREIVRFASEHRSDAIIAARRSRLEPGRGATLRTLLKESPCPILLVGSR